MPNQVSVFGFIYSRFCVARCDHCGSSSGPEVRGTIPFDYVVACLDDLPGLGIRSIVITGGEPLAFFADVLSITKRAAARGVGTMICSNGFWAKDPARAREKVAALAGAGLEYLMLSTDRFHVRYVPVEAVIHAANAAAEHGIACQIAVPALDRDWTSLSIVTRLQGETSAHVFTHPVHPVGRGEAIPAHRMMLEPMTPRGCDLVGHIEVDVDGTVSVCPTSADFDRASPLQLGNVGREPLRVIVNRFRTTLLFRVIATYGAVGLQVLLHSRDVARTVDASTFVHVCHLCRALNSSPSFHAEFRRRTGLDLVAPIDDAEFTAMAAEIDTAMAGLLSPAVTGV